MKQFLKISICIIGMMLSMFILSICFNTEVPFFGKLAGIIGVTSNNLLKNGDFKNDFKNWKLDKNISIFETNGIKFARFKGNSKEQTRIWQDINVVSGQIYHLIFSLNGPSQGAFVIYKDGKNGKEQYLWCNGKNEFKQYKWKISPTRTGKDWIYFSVKGNGDYYYTNIELIKKNVCIQIIYALFAIIIALLSLSNNIVLFITVFLIFFIPVIKTTKENKSDAENRMLAEYKPLLNEINKINVNYGSDFNIWINDHFWLRKQMISLNTDIKYLLNRRYENNMAFQGKEGWLFTKHYYAGDIKKTPNLIKDNIDKITKYYNERNIKIYFAIMPEKECFYSDKHAFRKYDCEKIPEKLSEMGLKNYIYLKNDLNDAKQSGFLFFKEDHHWTQLGAFVGYKAIMKMISKNNELKSLSESNFLQNKIQGFYDNQTRIHVFENIKKKGSCYSQLNLNDQNYRYKNYYETFFPTNHLPKMIEKGDRHAIFKGGINNKKVMVIGDSNIGYLLPFISTTFSDSLFLAAAGNSKLPDNWRIKTYETIINNFKPEIILVLIRGVNSYKWEELSEN